MRTELILVANAATARLFSRAPDGAGLLTLATLHHDASRHAAAERSGHGSLDSRSGGIAFQPRQDAKRKEQLHFADELARRVEAELEAGGHAGLVLFASSPFLGQLKQRLGPRARQDLRAAIDADLTSFPADEVQRRAAEGLLAGRA